MELSTTAIFILLTVLTNINRANGHDADYNGHEQADLNATSINDTDLETWQKLEAKLYVRKIFDKFGENGYLTFEGFEHLLVGLGLGDIAIPDHDIHDHKLREEFVNLHATHDHLNETHIKHDYATKGNGVDYDIEHSIKHNRDIQGDQHDATRDHSIVSGDHSDVTGDRDATGDRNVTGEHSSGQAAIQDPVSLILNHDHNHESLDNECMRPVQLLGIFKLQTDVLMSEHAFLYLCPAILHQLESQTCRRKVQPCPDLHQSGGDHFRIFHTNHSHEHDDNNSTSMVQVKWTFFSIPGKVWGYALLSVSVISLVGLLCVGIVPFLHKSLYDYLLQYLVALAVGTLTGDALLHLIPHALVDHPDKSHDHDSEAAADHAASVYKGCVVLGGIYTFFLAERLMGIMSEWRQRRHKAKKLQKKMSDLSFGRAVDDIGEKLSRYNDRYASCQNFNRPIHSNRASRLLTEENLEELMELQVSVEQDAGVQANDGHGHSHGGHGHSHTAPSSISAIAWMVIMGDGLHNFMDGLAIGAAFASSISVGLSTSIAVFCHELPHELGDFAVLLRAGMSIKLALFYNIVSSVLCFIGLVIGVAVGNISSASVWIFAMTAGIFIYISLVDMLPEITVVDGTFKNRQCCHLVLQLFGITTGVAIMLVIALFESKIQVS